jgi:hypothetical protein
MKHPARGSSIERRPFVAHFPRVAYACPRLDVAGTTLALLEGQEVTAMFEIPTSPLTRLLEGLEVHGPTAGELYLILISIHGVARALAAWAVHISLGQGSGL